MTRQNRRAMKFGSLIASAALALGVVVTTAAADPAISNGSFETPAAPSNNVNTAFIANPTIPFWSYIGGYIGGAWIGHNVLAATPDTPHGLQWLGLNTGLTNDAPNPNNNPTNLYVWQKIGTVEKGVYTFNYLLGSRAISNVVLATDGFFDISLWAGGDSPFDNTDQPTVLAGDSFGVQLGVDSAIDVPTTNSTMAESSVFTNSTTIYNGQDLWLRLHLQNNLTGTQSYNNGLNQMLFDNVTVSFIPEPSSLMLLTLGGGLMVLRRRKI